MKRLLVFTVLFPPIALAVFTAPDTFKNFFDRMWIAYTVAISPPGDGRRGLGDVPQSQPIFASWESRLRQP
jgi:hypothetical protein